MRANGLIECVVAGLSPQQALLEASAKVRVFVEKYSWGTLRTIEKGAMFSVIIHPEHVSVVRDGGKFRDETGRTWTVAVDGDMRHFKSGDQNVSVSVDALKLDD